MNRKRSTSGISHNSSRMVRIVIAMLNGDENRFSRSHASGPTVEAGGGCGSIAAFCRKRMSSARVTLPSARMLMTTASPLDQRHARVIDVHADRGHKADREVDRHGDQHDLDRLPGLVQHRAGEDLGE